MRVSSSALFESNIAEMTQQQARMMKTQQQVSSGRKMLTASDDPISASRALDVRQLDSMNTQYGANRGVARDSLSFAETALDGVTSLLMDIRASMIDASNGSLNSGQLKAIADDFSGRLQQLTGLANSTDEAGNYLFSGFQAKVQPFVDTPAGMGYFGDDGQRLVQVSASRQMPAGSSGADVFMRIKNGNGTFDTQPAVTNTGTGGASFGSVTNPALLTGNSYRVDFTVVAGVTTYSVTNTTTAAVVIPPGTAYVSGQAINFDGIQFDIKGAPNNGDSFNVVPSSNESVFKTISDVINALNSPVVGGNLANSLRRGIHNLDNAMSNIMSSRASLGLRLNEIDGLQTMGEDFDLQFKQTLSDLQDTDYAKSITVLTQQKMVLEAAQLSFTKVSGLSLFNYL